MAEPEPEVVMERSGWPAPLIDLYADHREELVRVARLMLGSIAEAEEVVQEAFVATARHWDRVEAPRSYLRRTVVNGANGVLRRRVIADRLSADTPPVDAPPPLVELRDLLLRLPLRQRAVIALYYLEGLADPEIAEVLECRPATVRSLRSRALAKIRKELT